VPTDETCDGLDTDCDGEVDEGMPDQMCGVGACATVVPACDNGRVPACVPGNPGVETCDGIDNDCDQQTDEGIPDQVCGVGACAAMALGCVNGMVPMCIPGMPNVEVCDGIDNDCDALIDESDPSSGAACSTGQPGVCDAGTLSCNNAAMVCVQTGQPSPEVCDGLDNDCNAQSDDGDPGGNLPCMTGQPGACGPGTTQCSGGQIVCNQNQQPSNEICDGTDNDCNGQIDDGNPGGGVACNTGLLGVCSAGTTACNNGSVVCNQNVQPSAENCNDNLDNDCDGQVNDGCAGNPCENIANPPPNNPIPKPTPSTSGGGGEPGYGPPRLNNGVGQTCSEWCWISNGQAPSGAFFQYEWSAPVTIGSFYVDSEHATAPACGTTGRDIKNAEVQWWNGSAWVGAGTIGNSDNHLFTFPAPVTTTRLRLFNVTTSPGNGNSIIFEWYVYSGTNCPIPP
jgi:hypothetical protein